MRRPDRHAAAGQALVRGVGARIAELRRAADLTQEQLAVRLGVTAQWVSLIERGRNLTLITLAKIAVELGVEPSSLFKPARPTPVTGGRGRPRKMS